MDSRGYTDGGSVGYTDKINSALTSPFPKAIDIENDIVKRSGFLPAWSEVSKV